MRKGLPPASTTAGAQIKHTFPQKLPRYLQTAALPPVLRPFYLSSEELVRWLKAMPSNVGPRTRMCRDFRGQQRQGALD